MNRGYMQDPESYELIIQSLKDYAVFSTDRQGIITQWSKGAENVLLYKADEILGRSCDILYTPEDIAALVPARELSNCLADGKAVNERFHVKKNRNRFWGSGLVFPLYNKQEEHIGFTKIMQNVSDEDQAEANLREERTMAETLVSTFIEPLVVLNTDMKVINATASFIQYFNLDKPSITGESFYDIAISGMNMSKLHTLLDRIIKSNAFHGSFEIEYEHQQRGSRSLLIKPRRIYQPPNILFSIEFEDLTEGRAKMEEKDIFISVASHEIRTPISVIKAYGQVLERELKDSKPIIKKAVQKINQQIIFVSSLITSLLDTSKITTGKLILNREAFDLNSLVNEQVESFSLTQSSHKIKIINEADGIVFADRVRIASVITNLLSNAVKYSPNANEVIISIDADPYSVKVSVQDFGLGIPVHEQNQIFQRFGRTESVRRSKIPGTGLGLHLASEIIKLEGGNIGFTTEEGKGSTFYFSLPLY